MKRIIAAALAVMALGWASAAAAAVHVVTFDVTGGSWIQVLGTEGPFGASSQPSFSGSLTVDRDAANPIVAFHMVTGSKTWTVADINTDYPSVIFNANGEPTYFWLTFAGGPIGDGNMESIRNLSISDGTNWIRCRGCFTVSGLGEGFALAPVPEPATWAMLIVGFGLAGSALRRRRQAGVVA